MKVFINSQFEYCRPLVWMYCDRCINYAVNGIHGRTLRLQYNDEKSSFKEMLETQPFSHIILNDRILQRKLYQK